MEKGRNMEEKKSNTSNNFQKPRFDDSSLSLEDQNWVNEDVSSSKAKKEYTRDNTYVNGSVNDTYKRPVNTKITLGKKEAIAKLKLCTHRTAPKEIAWLLESLFISYQSKAGHWLYIAQNWNPRAINRVIVLISKQYRRLDVSIKNPAAYFTYLIKRRKKRRNLTGINDTYKQQVRETSKGGIYG